MGRREEEFDLRSLLAAVEEASPVEAVDVLAGKLAGALEARHVALLVANFSGTALERLSHVTGGGRQSDGRNERTESVPLPGTAHERVILSQVPEVVEDGDGRLVLVPVTERGDVIGVLEVSLTGEAQGRILDYLVSAAHALAYVLVASRRRTDLFEWAQRDIPFSVAAEIQRRLLPSAYTLEAERLALAGWLEPSHDAGGDTFDYSLDRDHLYVTITDAVGHSVGAALLATLTVSTLRNRRRSLGSPAEQSDFASEVLRKHATPEQFVTGLIMRFRLSDGTAEVVNAGHPPPFLLRDGSVVPLRLTSQPPLGVTACSYRADTIDMKPGDRILLLTDGYLERAAQRLDIEDILLRTPERHPRQVVQELAHKVREVTGGDLRDDATVVCIDWYGPKGRRDAIGGASQEQATTP